MSRSGTLSSLCFNRWTLSILGLVIFTVLVLFVGPLLRIGEWQPFASPGSRIFTIVCALLVWAVFYIGPLLAARKTNKQVVEELAEDSGFQTGEEFETLSEGFQDALQVLKTARLGRPWSKRYLYQLPWFVIMGPPGAGKTTALRNSGLNFPLQDKLEKDFVPGVGGTRNCDWWFTDEAVLLDTAGRYTTQDSDPRVDKAGWNHFLGLIRKYRKRRPLDGVLVSFSLTDLLEQDPEERKRHARAIRKRLQELSAELKVQVPVYLIFTKCDLVAGFMEFFDELPREERDQVWGITFDPGSQDADPVRSFAPEYDELLDRLDRRMLARMIQERDPKRRGALFGFCQQMTSFKPALKQFITDTFQFSKFEPPCLFRGVYFSSATQTGSPMDRVIGSICGALGLDDTRLPAFSGPGRSYFLSSLLKDVVFKEADLAINTHFFDKYRPWVQKAAYAAGVLFLVGAGLIWSVSYGKNKSLVSDVEAQIAGLPQSAVAPDGRGQPLQELIRSLDIVHAIPHGYKEQQRPVPVSMQFGLFQGERLGSSARDTYLRMLNASLLPEIIASLEARIEQSAGDIDSLFKALKVYLMFWKPADIMDKNYARLWLDSEMEQRYPGPRHETLRKQYSVHLTHLLDHLDRPAPVDTALITQARKRISSRPLPQLLYSNIKQESLAAGRKPWNLADKVDRADFYFQRKSGDSLSLGIPSLFTYQGYREEFLPMLKKKVESETSKNWVLGDAFIKKMSALQPDQISKKIQEFYFSEYVQLWDAYLRDIGIRGYNNFQQAIEKLQGLAAADSPIKTFVVSVAQETDLSREAIPIHGSNPIAGKLSGTASSLEQVASADPGGLLGRIAPEISTPVDRRFKPIAQLTQASPDGTAAIDRVVQLLNELYSQISNAQTSGANLMRDEFSRVISRLQMQARELPQPLSGWVLTLANLSTNVTGSSIRSRLNSSWRTNIAQFCNEALGNRYPLEKNSPNDARLHDFAKFFGPEGRMDRFFRENLREIVDTNASSWRMKRRHGMTVKISNRALRQLQFAANVRESFFTGGGNHPVVKFSIRPHSLGKSARWVELDVGGQRLKFRNDAPRTLAMQWPPPDGRMFAKVTIKPKRSPTDTVISTEGPWALFRLLDKGTTLPTTEKDRFRVAFKQGGQSATFEIVAGSIHNPFSLTGSGNFQCLERL